jgi:hypothetical protein
MPRKPKAPFMLIVEGLSTAKSLAGLNAVFVDDLTGQEHPMDTEAVARQIVNDPKVLTDWRNRKRAVRLAKIYLEAKTYTDQRDKAHKLIRDRLNPPEPELKLAHNQMQLSNGKVLTVPPNPNALKRRF